MPHIQSPFYPIVYVRGYAMRSAEREETFYDTYNGFSATSVEKRQAPPPKYFEADVFEGQLIRFMKLRNYGYADATNQGEQFHQDPARSIWICRFYDEDYLKEKLRSIEAHADDLYQLVCQTIPARLKAAGVDLGQNDQDYRAILVAHSMGGLVCRTLIQNLLPQKYNQDPKRWIHRLVTIGTPHRGIELGRIPDFLENLVTSQLNPFDANIFKEERMREYLQLQEKAGSRFTYDVHSLGAQGVPQAFPVKRCLCVIGSDYHSYGAVREATGNFSDGLVKQDRAYVVGGPAPAQGVDYPDNQTCFWANVHRAHSGRRGIVNSYESFENIQRFLFGNIKVEIALENITLPATTEAKTQYLYDFEFLLAIRNSGSYLHRRQQDPCENAIRIDRNQIPPRLLMHTMFMNSALKDAGQAFSHFSAKFRVVERRIRDGLLWDREYPERPIYNETVEVRVGDDDPSQPGDEVQYRWLSDTERWRNIQAEAQGVYRFPLRKAGSLSAEVVIQAGPWPDSQLTKD